MIKNWQEYNELSEYTEIAHDRIETGQGQSGMHYMLMHILRSQHDIFANSREEAVMKSQQLLDDFVAAKLNV